ncbi:hypothetical protein F5887DRAFT_912399 [Amanita rubescens]|nr:hypothetical protein F5887DRAFT_912399 [Amanita rubescens]
MPSLGNLLAQALKKTGISGEPRIAGVTNVDDAKRVTLRREQYKCPYFRILVMGRANAGKTTILEKVCGVARGTQPIIIYDMSNEEINPNETHMIPSIEVLKSGARDELEIVQNFIAKRSACSSVKGSVACNLVSSLHYTLFPLVVVFTKFDGQIIQEGGKLDDIEEDGVKWDMAKKNAEITFQRVYLPKIFDTKHPPRAYVRLEDMDLPEKNCPELTEKTADAIDDSSLQELFVLTQRNNIGLCVKAGLRHILYPKGTSEIPLEISFIAILSKFPHYWKAELKTGWQGRCLLHFIFHKVLHSQYNVTKKHNEVDISNTSNNSGQVILK